MAKRNDPDPTVVGLRGDVPEYPEGTHPPHPISEQSWSGDRLSYSDAPDDLKPDESSIVQTVDEDPLEADTQKALADDAEAGQKRAAAEAKENK